MASMFALPPELLLSSIGSRYPCREQQILALSTLLSIRGAPCRNIVLHGLNATGKTAVANLILEKLSSSTQPNGISNEHFDEGEGRLAYASIKSSECISGRHLLQQTIGAVAKATEWQGTIEMCQNVSHLVVLIGKMMEKWTESFPDSTRRLILVFDGIDYQRDIPATLLPAMARIGEIVPNITLIYIVTAPRPNFLHLPGVPHIHFPAYTKSELLQILTLTTPTPELHTGPADTLSLWKKFCPAIYDTLSKSSGRDILSFRQTCLLIWPRFIRPLLDGWTASFPNLMITNRALLQEDTFLIPSVVAHKPTNSTKTQTQAKLPALTNQLPFYTRILLLASYLASFNPPKTDLTHFTKSALARRRKKGGGTARSRTTSSKHRKISRKLLGAQTFILERMLAIFQCLKEDARHGRKRNGSRTIEREDISGSADIQSALATLASLRLLVKVGAANAGDTLEGSCRYRVAVSWEVVRGIGRSIGVEMEEYLAE